MKYFKKFFSYLVALTMVLSLAAFTGVKVYAADATTYTLTLTGTASGHTYEAYQVFTGDLSTDKGGNKVLSNVTWGDGVTSKSKADAADVAKRLDNNYSGEGKLTIDDLINDLNLKTPVKTVESSKDPTVIDGLAAGYYLVKDKDGSQANTSDAYTKFIVQVVGNTKAAIKSGVPTVEKKVKDTNDSTDETSGWQDSADYDIGDWVPYQITGTMPSRINDYKTYSYKFTDTMSKGLTFDEDNTEKNYKATHKAKITLDGIDVTSSFEEKIAHNTDETTTVEWSCSNLKGINKNAGDTSENAEKLPVTENSKVVVTYSAKLNENAVIGAAGNPNTVYLTYSNNPNKNGEGDTGKTPEDKNIVFTYKLDVNKYKDNKDDVNNKTDEAEFKLYKEIKGTNGESDSVKPVNLTKANKVYSAVGLDDGVYILQETKAPDGYNKIDGNVTFAGTTYENAREFTVEATHSNSTNTLDPELTSLTGTKKTGEITLESVKDNSNKPTGTLTTDVIDKKGSTLPSTGGMGTTLLYVAGGILVACAAAYVIISRKKSAKK